MRLQPSRRSCLSSCPSDPSSFSSTKAKLAEYTHIQAAKFAVPSYEITTQMRNGVSWDSVPVHFAGSSSAFDPLALPPSQDQATPSQCASRVRSRSRSRSRTAGTQASGRRPTPTARLPTSHTLRSHHNLLGVSTNVIHSRCAHHNTSSVADLAGSLHAVVSHTIHPPQAPEGDSTRNLQIALFLLPRSTPQIARESWHFSLESEPPVASTSLGLLATAFPAPVPTRPPREDAQRCTRNFSCTSRG